VGGISSTQKVGTLWGSQELWVGAKFEVYVISSFHFYFRLIYTAYQKKIRKC